jgi:hypothetical protein
VKLLAAFGLAFLSTLAVQPPIAGKLVAVKGTVSEIGPQLPPGYLRVAPVPFGLWRRVAEVFIKWVRQGESCQPRYAARGLRGGYRDWRPRGAPLQIVAGTNFATLRVTTSGQAPSTERILVFFWIDGGPDGPLFPVSPDGSDMVSGGGISVPPGRYLVCAFVAFSPG